MDLHHIDEHVYPRSRSELRDVTATDGILAGGTWLMSEPQPAVRRLVDLGELGWPALHIGETALTIAATCTIDTLISAEYPSAWRATAVFPDAARALLASFKIWRRATVGGNLCLGFPAGSMIALCAALNAEVLIWAPDGSDRRMSVPEFVTGNCATALRTGEVLRSVTIPAAALRQPTVLRKLALSPLGRSGSVVIGRRDGSGLVVCVTAATVRPHVVRIPVGSPDSVATAVTERIPVDDFYDDPHGAADWRRHVTGVLVAEVARELSG